MHFLVFQHLAVEHPGVFRDFWHEAGVNWTTIELDEGELIPSDLSRYDALVVMGGPMNTWQTDRHPWLVPEIEAIRTFVADVRKPYLGVCLGHQLLACALDGTVAPAAVPEVGPCSIDLTEAGKADPLFLGVPSPLLTFQWHGAEVKTLPSNAVALAQTDICQVQAFRWQSHAYGLQFHAEITEQTVDEWRRVPEYAQSLDKALGPSAGECLEAEMGNLLPRLNEVAYRLNANFLALVRGGTVIAA